MKKHILLIRFSALGDVLMTIPVVYALAHQYPSARITVAGPPLVQGLFERLPENVDFEPIRVRDYSGLRGIYRLYRRLANLQPTHICDLHDVLRTKVVRLFFSLFSRLPITHIRKRRRDQRRFLSRQPKTQQPTVFAKYADALRRLGFPVDSTLFVPFPVVAHKGGIGIAPFAAHKGKVYPLKKMEEVVRLLAERGQRVYIFGAGEEEKAIAENWTRYDGVKSMIGQLGGLAQELDFIAQLDVMLTMDSANMHLAALTSTPVVSIWGATHPYGGFMGWGQDINNVLQREDLPCRPCSMYGKKPCTQGDYPCLNGISPESVVERVMLFC